MPATHGTESCHSAGCRRDECRAAHAAGARRRRRLIAYGRHVPKSIPNIGSRRRIEALMTLGWSMRTLSRRAGWHPDRINVMLLAYDGISPGNAAKIAALYDELWDRRPPQTTKGERISARRTVALARQRRYAPPLAWDDDEIDNPAAAPHAAAGHSAWDHQPCGTAAAARRHYRRGEPLDEACRATARRVQTERRAAA